MKLLSLLLSVVLAAPPSIMVIDTGLKTEMRTAGDFTIDDFFKRSFPIYADDVPAVIEATEKMARIIDRNVKCIDSIKANRTVMYLRTNCDSDRAISVRLVTSMEGKIMIFD